MNNFHLSHLIETSGDKERNYFTIGAFLSQFKQGGYNTGEETDCSSADPDKFNNELHQEVARARNKAAQYNYANKL